MSTSHLHTRWEDLKQRVQHTSATTLAASSPDSQRKNEVYRQRAVRLARPVTQAASSRDATPTLVFVLGDQHFGISLSRVAQVYPARPLTPVPRAPAWILGIASFEAQIRSVIDLAKLLNVSDDRSETEGNILLVRCSDGAVAVGVDRVEEVQNIDFGQLSAPDQPSNPARTRFIRGATPEHLVILCPDALLAHVASPRGQFS